MRSQRTVILQTRGASADGELQPRASPAPPQLRDPLHGSLSLAAENGTRGYYAKHCHERKSKQGASLSKSTKKKGAGPTDPNEKIIAMNRKARHKYLILESLECGLALVGSEVKSLRNGGVSLDEAYAKVKDGEVWLVGCDIAEYTEASHFNHQPRRNRKILMHRKEVKRFACRAFEKGLTLVPLEMHFKRGLAKVVLGICRGKQQHDKREALKKAEVQRDIARQMMRRR